MLVRAFKNIFVTYWCPVGHFPSVIDIIVFSLNQVIRIFSFGEARSLSALPFERRLNFIMTSSVWKHFV